MSFIRVTDIDGNPIRINSTWIEGYYRDEKRGETFITMTSEALFVVKDSPDDIDSMIIELGSEVVELDQNDKPKLVVFKGKADGNN